MSPHLPGDPAKGLFLSLRDLMIVPAVVPDEGNLPIQLLRKKRLWGTGTVAEFPYQWVAGFFLAPP